MHKKLKKKIVFVTGTRADYGKLKSIIKIVQNNNKFEAVVFVTGMHNLSSYGNTHTELNKDKIKNLFKFKNQVKNDSMDIIVSKTINVFSKFIKKINPDLIVIHGDRVEPLACAVVGSLNNILVAHIEGGEVSGTVDEILRHSISKLSHIHFVSNKKAKQRLIQMGEIPNNIFIIGSPDVDLMSSRHIPNLNIAKKRYKIKYNSFAILLFHPVVSKQKKNNLKKNTSILINAIKNSKFNYIVVFPNNDSGSNIILNAYKTLKNKKNIKIFPSLRFEYYLSLLKASNFIIGNSSSGVREAPYYGTPTINIGNRQNKRSSSKSIINVDFKKNEIEKLIKKFKEKKITFKKQKEFGDGKADKKFVNLISKKSFWKIDNQKYFKDKTL
tara:strand:+ start:4386 stop:5537 length:1152 start_codon:yes stop_codon:yes gene_type:complete